LAERCTLPARVLLAVSSSRLLTPKNWPLATKLASVMFVLALIPLVVVALVNARDVETQVELRERDALERRATAAGRRLEERVARLRAYVELLASNPALSEAMSAEISPLQWFDDHPQVRELLVSVRAGDPWFQNVYLLDANGICVATSEALSKPEMIGRSYDYRPYFRQPRATGRPFVSDVLKNANSPGTAIFVSARLASGGVAVIKIDTAALHDVVADLAGGGGRVWMVDRFGVVVSDATAEGFHGADDPTSLQFHPLGNVDRYLAQFEETKRYGDPAGDNYFDRMDRSLQLDELWLRLLRNAPGADEFTVPATPGATGQPTMVGFSPVWSDEEQPYGYVVIGEASAEFREPLQSITRDSLLRIVLAFAGVAVVIAVSLRGLSRRVGELADATQRLATGDRGIQLATEPADELGVLAASFNRLSADLAESLADLEAQRQRADEAREEAVAEAKVRDALLVRVGQRMPALLELWQQATLDVQDPTQLAALEAAHREAAIHVDALRSMSSAGMQPPTLESLDLTRLLRAAVTRAQTPASLSGTSVELELDNQIGRVSSDAARLTAVLDELLANATRFTRRGSVRVVARRLPNDAVVEVQVIDDGVGMTRGERGQLHTPQPREDGAGLGLHLAARFAEHIGVSLKLQGNPGEGTTVTLRIPAS
jgi:signal transduction histidine kinase